MKLQCYPVFQRAKFDNLEVNSNGSTLTLPLCGIDGLFTSPSNIIRNEKFLSKGTEKIYKYG
jgi:hypothetical protein